MDIYLKVLKSTFQSAILSPKGKKEEKGRKSGKSFCTFKH